MNINRCQCMALRFSFFLSCLQFFSSICMKLSIVRSQKLMKDQIKYAVICHQATFRNISYRIVKIGIEFIKVSVKTSIEKKCD